jgi:hypothetical protein
MQEIDSKNMIIHKLETKLKTAKEKIKTLEDENLELLDRLAIAERKLKVYTAFLNDEEAPGESKDNEAKSIFPSKSSRAAKDSDIDRLTRLRKLSHVNTDS